MPSPPHAGPGDAIPAARTPPDDPLVVRRTIDAPRARVFAAFSTAERVKRWFAPATMTAPEATVDFRPGGVFDVCMRFPDGRDAWSRGRFVEIAPDVRLTFVSEAMEGAFSCRTTIDFEDGDGGVKTELTVRQDYEVRDPAARAALAGAPEGWRTTLDKLEAEVARGE